MRMSFRRMTALALALILCVPVLPALAEPVSFRNKAEALKYIEKNHPTELTLENVKLKPTELLEIKQALPEGATFHFTTKWGTVTFSDDAEEVDLRSKKNLANISELEAIVGICPNVKVIDNSKNTSLNSKAMVPLIEKYPDIRFEWVVDLGKGYKVSTRATAYSTFKHVSSGQRLKSEDLEQLKYCPRLKALDLGHHDIKSLDFLKYVPDLELLIVVDSYVSDLTPVGELKHLKYAELFKNKFTDLSPLANCTELLDLNLTSNEITDLSALDNVQSLERLWVNSCKKLPQEAVDHFKELHPNCEVDFKISHAATVDGWRKHPRYFHFIWCLKNRKWIPFDEEIPK